MMSVLSPGSRMVRLPRTQRAHTVPLFGLLLLLLPASANGADKEKLFVPRDRRDVQTEVLQAITKMGVRDEATLDRVTQLWSEPATGNPRDLFELVVQTFAVVDPETGRFVDSCRFNVPVYEVPKLPQREDPPACYSANLGLYYGRYLAQRRLYDESLAVLKGISPQAVVDPGMLLFFKAVCQHQLLHKDAGLRTLDQLLTQTVGVPLSYRQISELMQYELSNVREKSLDELARMMGDVGRRLDLGRGGQRVQKKEQEVIARLDEMIEKLEQQQGSGGGSAQNQGGNQNQPAQAAQDSRVKGTKAAGEADEKKLAGQGGWGMLDPKAETKARESIKRNFPSHYSEAIKRYNIKLAK